MKDNDDSVSGSAVRRTRFQAAPDWSIKESLILVNEVATVEAEWSTSLSSYQQWEIIAENCAAVDVRRNLGQCRRKWHALLSQYDAVRNSFGDNRKVDFDPKLFKAIDRVVKAREDRGVVGAESDPETVNEARDATIEIGSLGSKRRGRRSKSERHHTKKLRKCQPVESSEKFSEEQDQRGCPEQTSDESDGKEEPENQSEEEYLKDFLAQKAKLKCNAENPPKHIQMPLKSIVKEEPHDKHHIETPNQTIVGKITVSREENEEIMTLKLQELAEEIEGINAESAADSENAENNRIEFIRCQGDKLIASLGNFSNTLKQLCDLLQECK